MDFTANFRCPLVILAIFCDYCQTIRCTVGFDGENKAKSDTTLIDRLYRNYLMAAAFFLQLFQQLCFAGALVGLGLLLWGRVNFIRRNIQLGKPVDRTDRQDERLRNMLLIAFGQKKMFERPLVGLMHFVIYAGFLIINIEVLEIVLDGLLGTHRLFAPVLGGLYGYLINFFELLALGVVLVCVLFLLRRNVLPIARFQKPELNGFPRRDANIILVWEIVLMTALFTMNATDGVLQQRAANNEFVAAHFPLVGTFAVSGWLTPLFEGYSTTSLLLIERFAWWIHILGIFAFAVYVTYSKHLHIFLAFPNTYFAKLNAKGEIDNMPEISNEVRSMLGIAVPAEAAPVEIARFGAKDANELHWKSLLDAYACTECGRCTSSCPANLTGKKLSPRKVMMDTRDRIEEIGRGLDEHGPQFADNRSLYGDFITKEELMACTTCNACVEACPVNINPLDIILQLRRYVAMEESGTPQSWNAMFANVENNGAPWAFPASDRFKWAEEAMQR